MRWSSLIRRGLTHYWRTNLAVVAGVAVTVAVIAGALLVGDSVRASLQLLAQIRLGDTSYVIASDGFFRESLPADIKAQPDFPQGFNVVPLIALEGIVAHEKSGRRASSVQVYGVTEAFWEIQNRNPDLSPKGREALLSPSLADELSTVEGDSILLRLQKPSDVPLESLHGHKDDLSRAIRLTSQGTLPAHELGEFSLRPQQGSVRAIFVPLRRLQTDLAQPDKINTILITELSGAKQPPPNSFQQLLQRSVQLPDLGLRLRPIPSGFALESDRLLLDDRIASAARSTASSLNLSTTEVLTYLANTIRIGNRVIPYSLVSAISPTPPESPAHVNSPNSSLPPLWLNEWALRDLSARLGDTVTLDYFLWNDDNRLRTESAQFRLDGSVLMSGLGSDRTFAPEFPGITDSADMSDWNPPFPIDLKRVRPRDEDYWHTYRTAPKAFIPLASGQKLWRSRFGRLTSLRFTPKSGAQPAAAEEFSIRLRAELDPLRAGFHILPVRSEALAASQGAVNFGEYFFYFSFFLVVSAILLTGLFFKLGVEQRLREIGLFEALGFPPGRIRSLALSEGLLLAVVGSVLGLVGAVAYGALMMYGLRTWWVGAVGTTYLSLHISPFSLSIGAFVGIIAALLCILWTLRGLRRISPRNLLTGSTADAAAPHAPTRRAVRLGLAFAAAGLAFLLLAATGILNQVAGFFASGALLLAALVALQVAWLSRPPRRIAFHPGLAAVSLLGARNAAWRPGRSLVSIALIASATFVIVAVDAFRRSDTASLSTDSGTGGYPLLAESLLPIPFDPNTFEGKRSLNLSDNAIAALHSVQFFPFRLRPGDDASCLNLYQPRNPQILGVPESLIRTGRFAFQSSLAETPEQKQNPWLLLNRTLSDGAIPTIADANSLAYVLHLKLGDELVLGQSSGIPVRLKIVAALRDSIFQGALLIGEQEFLRAFPPQQGFRFFLLDTSPQKSSEIAAVLEQNLSDFGFDVQSTSKRLTAFHRVENTYLSTFQALGGLGLLLGTLGLAAILLRNVLERRRELALLRAVGYRRTHLALLILSENLLLLVGGLLSGLLAAAVAIAPALVERGGIPPLISLTILLAAVLFSGLMASLVAVFAALRAPLLVALRTE